MKSPRKGAKEIPLLGITMGDPAGIGPEVIAKAFAATTLRRVCQPLVIGSCGRTDLPGSDPSQM